MVMILVTFLTLHLKNNVEPFAKATRFANSGPGESPPIMDGPRKRSSGDASSSPVMQTNEKWKEWCQGLRHVIQVKQAAAPGGPRHRSSKVSLRTLRVIPNNFPCPMSVVEI